SPRDQLRCVAIQAALLAAGSLDPEVMRNLARRPALARRYLAVEGHRALAAQEALLPTVVRSLIDRAVAARSESPVASLAIAMGREALADPPEIFGMVRPRHVRTRVEPPVEERAVQQHVPQGQGEDLLREPDDGEDKDNAVPDFVSGPIGGGGL